MRRLPDVRCRDARIGGRADSAIASTSTPAPKRDSRRSILDAAARIIRAKGAGAATLREIADAAGIKPGSVYYHFASKDEIVAAVMNDGVDYVREQVEQTLASLPAGIPSEQRLEAAIRSHLHALLEYSDYTSAGLKTCGDAPEFVRAAAQPHRRQYEDLWRELIEELIRSGHAPAGISGEALRLAILGVMNWSPEWYRPSKHAIDDLARQFAALFSRRGDLSPR